MIKLKNLLLEIIEKYSNFIIKEVNEDTVGEDESETFYDHRKRIGKSLTLYHGSREEIKGGIIKSNVRDNDRTAIYVTDSISDAVSYSYIRAIKMPVTWDVIAARKPTIYEVTFDEEWAKNAHSMSTPRDPEVGDFKSTGKQWFGPYKSQTHSGNEYAFIDLGNGNLKYTIKPIIVLDSEEKIKASGDIHSSMKSDEVIKLFNDPAEMKKYQVDAERKRQEYRRSLREDSGGATMNLQDIARHNKKLGKLKKVLAKQGNKMIEYPKLDKTVFGVPWSQLIKK